MGRTGDSQKISLFRKMNSNNKRISTPLTTLLHIEHPILLAGMANIANADLVAAVCNAGGMGVLGGVTFTPNSMRKAIKELKEKLHNPNASFGIDLLIPQVGGSARKTNKDYTVSTVQKRSKTFFWWNGIQKTD